ncbi:MAG: hypothetical protein AAGI92_10910 [Pseudomonadota bacterium]
MTECFSVRKSQRNPAPHIQAGIGVAWAAGPDGPFDISASLDHIDPHWRTHGF